MIAAKITVSGDAETSANLAKLGAAMQGRIMRKALRAGSAVVIRKARALAPKDTGTLRKSIGVKIKTYANKQDFGGKLRNVSTGRTVAIIGPRVGIEGIASRSGQLNADKTYKLATGASGKVIVRVPTRYAHLVEKGTRPHSIKSAVDMKAIRRGRGPLENGWNRPEELGWSRGRQLNAARERARDYLYRRDLSRHGQSAVHPGAKPKPFLIPGMETSKAMVNSVLSIEISKGILEEARKCSTRTLKRGS